MPLLYSNKEYVDHILDISTDTIDEGADKVSQPFKMLVRDVTLLIEAQFNNAIVIIEYSPDNMETQKGDLVPATMSWYSRSDGTFTDATAGLIKFWENIEGAEGWFRIRVKNHAGVAALKVRTRPRVEKALA